MGCALQANLGQTPARQAAKFAGLPDSVICTTVNKAESSGMKAITQAVQSILLGDADVVVAGGMESMSNVPFYSYSVRWGNKYGNTQLIDGLAKDGMTNVYDGDHLAVVAELCARECNITRSEQDAFAIESYRRAQMAWNSGKFKNEVLPITISHLKGETVVVKKDEEAFNIKFEKIPLLKPISVADGTITTANSAAMTDGAAALVLMSKTKADSLGLKPLAKIRSYADAEQAPEWFTTSPSLAMPTAVFKAGLKMEEIDFWEMNDPYSIVGIENSRRMQLNPAKLNVFGGAISLGNPIGCSGARVVVTLLNVLKFYKGKYGAAGVGNAGGGASAIVLER